MTVNDKPAKVSIRGEFAIGRIVVDGVDISRYVTNIEYRHKAGDIPVVTIDMAVLDGVEIEADARTVIERYD